jgi:hypothetical protein
MKMVPYIVEQPRMSKDRLDVADLRARKVQAVSHCIVAMKLKSDTGAPTMFKLWILV